MTFTAFDSVVRECVDDSVGGFHISASYRPDLKSFCFSEKSGFYSDIKQIVKPGETIKFYLSPCDGGFSYHQIPKDNQNLLLKIDQMEHMILYSSQFRLTDWDLKNQKLFGLMLPILVEQNNNGEIIVSNP